MESFNKFSNISFIVLLIAGLLYVTLPTYAQNVDIPDNVLRSQINQVLGKAADAPITEAEMLTLTELPLNDLSDLSDLTGLEHATNLETLYISKTGVTDISAVTGLTKLQTFWLNNTNVSNLSYVSQLTALTDLAFNKTGVTDISAVSGLTKLQKLRLHGTGVSDISAVAGLTNLQVLYIHNTEVTDLAPGLGLTGLTDFRYDNIPALTVPATLTLVSGDNQQGDAGATLSAPYVVEVQNQVNTVLADVSVSFSVTAGGGSLSATSVSTDADGHAETTLTLGATAGTNTVEASVQGITTPVTFTATANALPTATTLTLVSGNQQTGDTGSVLAAPFVVKVSDQNNTAMADVSVSFSVTAGGGSLSATSVSTDTNGEAETTLTLGATAGTNTVEASVQGITTPVTFTATATALPTATTLTLVSGNQQTGDTGSVLAASFVVKVSDQNNTAMADVSVSFSVTAGGGSLSATTVSTDADGHAETTLTLGATAGTNTVEASVQGITSTITFNATANALPTATTLTLVSGNQQTGDTESVLAAPFVVKVSDQNNAAMADVSVSFSVTAGGGSLSATTVSTDTNGEAETTLTLGATAGTNTVAASVTGITIPVTFTATATALPTATTLTLVSGNQQTGGTNSALSAPFVVKVSDQNNAAMAGVSVSFSVTAGGGSLSTTTATTDADGHAETTLTLGATAGTNTVAASVQGITSTITFTATAISYVNIPDDVLRSEINQELGKAADAPITEAEMLTLTELPLNDLSDLSDLTGLAYATNLEILYISKTGVSDISAVAGLTKLQTFWFNNTNVSNLSHISQLTALTDLAFNKTGVTDISAVSGLTKLQKLRLHGTGVSDISAVAGLTNLQVLYIHNTEVTDLAPGLGLTGLTDFRYDNTPALTVPATLTLVSGDNQQGDAGATLSAPYVVEVQNQVNTVLADVSVSFSVTAGGGSLSATTVSTDADGHAETTLTLGATAGTNTVAASVQGITSTITFTATANEAQIATTFTMVSGDGQTGSPGSVLAEPFVVKVSDQNDAPMEGVTVYFTALKGGGLSGTADTTDADGHAETTLTLGTFSGTNTVEAGVWGITNRITVTATGVQTATTLTLVSGDGQKSTPSSTLDAFFVVKVTDQNGAIMADVPVTFSVTAGGGSLSTTTTTTNGLGTAQTTLTLGPTQGATNTVEASAEGITNKITFTATASETPRVTKLRSVSGDQQIGLAGSVLSDPFVVKVSDQNNAPMADASVSFSVTDGDGSLSATTVSTDTDGEAETTLTLGTTPGNHIVRASIQGFQGTIDFKSRGVQKATTLTRASGNSQTRTPGSTLAAPFVVKVTDQNNLVMAGVSVAFRITAGGGSLSTTTATTGAEGQAQTTLTLGPTQGATNTVEASVEGITNKITFTATASETPTATTLTRLSGDGQTKTPGTILSAEPFVVEVADQNNVVMAGVSVAFRITAGGGSLSTTTATTDAEGRAETILTLGTTAGTNTVEASVQGITNTITFTATAGVQTATTLTRLSGDSQIRTPNSALTEPFVVEVADQHGRGMADVPVSFSVTAGGGSLSTTTATTDADGHAETTLTLGATQGTTNTVAANVQGITNTVTFIAIAEAPTDFSISGHNDNQKGVAGTPLPKPIVAYVGSNQGAVANVEVAFEILQGSGSLGATTVTTDANGAAQTTLTPSAGVNIVKISAKGAQGIITAKGINIPKTFTMISGDQQVAIPWRRLPQPLVVEVRDQANNPLAGQLIGFTVTSGGGFTLDPYQRTDSNGRAQVTLELGRTDTVNTVDAKLIGFDSSLEEKVIDTIRFTATGTWYESPLPLVLISGAGQRGIPSSTLSQPFVVEVRDENGNPLENETVVFNLQKGGGSLSATTATTGANGRAETTLTLGSNTGSNVIEASVSGKTGKIKFAGEAANLPASIIKIAGDNQTLEAANKRKNFPIYLEVEVRDQNGNPLRGVTLQTEVTSGAIFNLYTNGFWSDEWLLLPETDQNGRAKQEVQILRAWHYYLYPEARDVTVEYSIEGLEQTVEFSLTVEMPPLDAPPLVPHVSNTADIQSGIADADENGVINAADLVAVAAGVGIADVGKNTPLDINRDGVVDNADIQQVLAALEGQTGTVGVFALDPVMLQRWIDEAKRTLPRDATFYRGIAVLEDLVDALTIPERTVLLANYPNPFNPETWFPYQLAESANVTLTIYDMNGRVVRILPLGHQEAGSYRSRSRAAYWDGQNAVGEPVASGVYFYTLTAAETTLTRKMFIRK